LHRTEADKLSQVYVLNQSHRTLVIISLLTAICFVSVSHHQQAIIWPDNSSQLEPKQVAINKLITISLTCD